ncbi:dephospho-CoA kinase [Halalkalibacterium ligniniphilum]|uniref:dephospho-CoA kinase n=1 Tax=Halalkalibacterium ligniniphilum TaxID=1134413 RepID=UPI00034D4C9A|nr:dephospho-CoA kinase [Halalkalibacterium ligniniphilum]
MIIGLTGGIASGKTSVSKMFKELKIPVVDADQIAREVVQPGEDAYKRIVAHFGKGILQEDGTIERKKLGAIVFNDDSERNVLNGIVHPAVRERMQNQRKEYEAQGAKSIVFDIPLLYESNLFHLVDKVLLVYVDEAVQLKRLMDRDQAGEEDAQSRISSQLPLKGKIEKADAVINNNGTLAETRAQLEKILDEWNVKPS